MAIENIIAAGLSVLALALTIIGSIAYRRTRDRWLLLLTVAFALFLAKGIILTVVLFIGRLDLATLFVVTGVFDLVILGLFYGVTLRH
ncbi:MAG TPA: hypothetical protein VJN63_03010 [Thermoplasmata archaeon]|nr:hypothetical protein [Thermoplasmata archaeon]